MSFILGQCASHRHQHRSREPASARAGDIDKFRHPHLKVSLPSFKKLHKDWLSSPEIQFRNMAPDVTFAVRDRGEQCDIGLARNRGRDIQRDRKHDLARRGSAFVIFIPK